MPALRSGLSLESLGHLNYLRGVLAQPLGSWQGFYVPRSPSMNFALRYQLAFASYAVTALSRRTPGYLAPYAEALRGAIDKMLDVAAWGYWHAPDADSTGESRTGPASSGHVQVLLSPHQRTVAGPPSDPIARDNLQYSGHLSTMLGLYEKVSGDDRYDRPFTLHDPASGATYTYTHGQVARRIHEQMLANRFGGVCCEQGMAYVPCNNHALASNTLHDALHGTRFAEANAAWLRTVEKKMVLKGPALRGVFGASYVKDLNLATPLAFNFTDAWGLAFMLPFAPSLVRSLYGRFKQRVARAGRDGAYVDSTSWSENLEISDVALNTGFGAILARGVGDVRLASALGRYAAKHFDPAWDGSSYYYKAAPRTLHSTALYALAAATEPGGSDFEALFTAPPHLPAPGELFLDAVSSTEDRVGVSRAEYNPTDGALHLGLRWVGAARSPENAAPAEVTLVLGNARGRVRVEAVGVEPYELEPSPERPAKIAFALAVPPAGEVACVFRPV